MNLKLCELHVGKVDGKHEYLTPKEERVEQVFDTFMMPDSVDPHRMSNGDIFYIEGLRGTGKTSLLRWHAEKKKSEGSVTDFILFKSDLTETQRVRISSEVGVSWTDVDPEKMDISQDFKDAWQWFILHKIGENLKKRPEIFDVESKENVDKFIHLLGLNDDKTFTKVLGFLPKLEGATVKIGADIKFFKAELDGDFQGNESHGRINFSSLVKKILSYLTRIKLHNDFFLYFDELEAFYHSQ